MTEMQNERRKALGADLSPDGVSNTYFYYCPYCRREEFAVYRVGPEPSDVVIVCRTCHDQTKL